MKKIVCAMLCILLVFSLSACGGNVNEVNTHNVESEIYSEEDIATAIDTIKKEFKSNWNGCTLTEIYYAGDDSSKDHQDWQIGTMQMKSLFCYLRSMLIQLEEMVL